MSSIDIKLKKLIYKKSILLFYWIRGILDENFVKMCMEFVNSLLIDKVSAKRIEVCNHWKLLESRVNECCIQWPPDLLCAKSFVACVLVMDCLFQCTECCRHHDLLLSFVLLNQWYVCSKNFIDILLSWIWKTDPPCLWLEDDYICPFELLNLFFDLVSFGNLCNLDLMAFVLKILLCLQAKRLIQLALWHWWIAKSGNDDQDLRVL